MIPGSSGTLAMNEPTALCDFGEGAREGLAPGLTSGTHGLGAGEVDRSSPPEGRSPGECGKGALPVTRGDKPRPVEAEGIQPCIGDIPSTFGSWKPQTTAMITVNQPLWAFLPWSWEGQRWTDVPAQGWGGQEDRQEGFSLCLASPFPPEVDLFRFLATPIEHLLYADPGTHCALPNFTGPPMSAREGPDLPHRPKVTTSGSGERGSCPLRR